MKFVWLSIVKADRRYCYCCNVAIYYYLLLFTIIIMLQRERNLGHQQWITLRAKNAPICRHPLASEIFLVAPRFYSTAILLIYVYYKLWTCTIIMSSWHVMLSSSFSSWLGDRDHSLATPFHWWQLWPLHWGIPLSQQSLSETIQGRALCE